MILDFSSYSYFPAIFCKPAEMRALEELPEHEKDLILPTLLLRPWVNSKQLENTFTRFEKAFGDRPFFVDVDRYYRPKSGERPAVSDFIRLSDPNKYDEFFGLLDSFPFACPCIRVQSKEEGSIQKQIDAASASEKPFMFRFQQEDSDVFSNVLQRASHIEHANYLFGIDCGWSTDLLSRELWASNAVRNISQTRPELSIVVSGSSFPDTFENVEPSAKLQIKERALFDAVVAQNNAAVCHYGDWASIRKPANVDVPMQTVPRIDYARERDWSLFRFRTADGGYRRAAEVACGSESWVEGLSVWGTMMIEATAAGGPEEITNPTVATAVRANLHMHAQVNYENPAGFMDTEDDFVD